MIPSSEIRLAPSVSAMNAFLEPHRQWMESVLGCATADSVTFELAVPFAQFAAEDLLKGVALDRRCLFGAEVVRPAVVRWEIPPGISPRIELCPSHDPSAPITSRAWGWDPHWRETPVAIWLKDLDHAIVAANIPYVSFTDGPRHKWKDWLVVNRAEVAAALNLLATVLAHRPKRITMIGGRDIPLEAQDCGWDSLVLDAEVSHLVKEDFELFFQREAWFKRNRLPFQRGYLFYGPPGNGKTSAVRAMAVHPDVRAFSLDFSNDELPNDAMTELFEEACHAAPSLVIFEDLDRIYGNAADEQRPTKITFQHLQNCLDGLRGREGTVVVATANHPERLDTAMLCRPGRFDRVVSFPPPSEDLCRDYLLKLTGGHLKEITLKMAAEDCGGLSFAQIREAYILAGQLAMQRNDEEIRGEDLLDAISTVRNGANGVGGRLGIRETGFAALVKQTAP